jgi:predicted DNA-binding transcriptional regulator AlpA
MTTTPATLGAADLARELGRSRSWIYEHWPALVKDQAMPRPLHNGEHPLTWSRAHIMSWLDRDLPAKQRIAAAAFRAAESAAQAARPATRAEISVEEHRQRLEEKLATPAAP